jgi:Multiubiquitin
MDKPKPNPDPRPDKPKDHPYTIKIDRTVYKVDAQQLTGLQLRHLSAPPIGADRDLFEVVPGGSDVKVLDEQVVQMRDGLRFFTAPAQINPGACK